jgi:hypothetical protein
MRSRPDEAIRALPRTGGTSSSVTTLVVLKVSEILAADGASKVWSLSDWSGSRR